MRTGSVVDALEVPMPFEVDETRLRATLLEAKDSVDSRAGGRPGGSRDGGRRRREEGLALDVFGTLQAFRESLYDDAATFEAKFAHTPASRTAAQLAGASIAATLGEFETHYNTSFEVADRTHNLKVAARRIDGMVLMPGEEFGFNSVVGERSALSGFRDAPVSRAASSPRASAAAPAISRERSTQRFSSPASQSSSVSRTRAHRATSSSVSMRWSRGRASTSASATTSRIRS